MRLAASSVVLGLALLLASHPAAATPRRLFPSGNRTIAPLAAEAPTVTVNAVTTAPAPSTTNHTVTSTPAYGRGGGADGVAPGTAGTSEVYYEGQSCDADIFAAGGDDDDGEGGCGGGSEGGGGTVVLDPPSSDPPPASSGDDDDDDNKKKSDDDDDDKSNSSSSSSSSGSSSDSDSSEHTLDLTPKLHGTHALNVSRHRHSSSPVSRFALIGVAIVLPLRRRSRRAR